MKRKLGMVASSAAAVATVVLLFRFERAVASGVSLGLSMCGAVLIPSLLPFMVVVGTWMRLPLHAVCARWLARPTAAVFRLPGCCGMPILLSMLGGYPAGALAVEQLLSRGQITEVQAARMMHFCVNAGPAFAVSAVGANLLGDKRLGWLLYGAHVSASVIIGVVQGHLSRRPLERHAARCDTALPFSVAFAQAVNHAVLSLLYLCGFVVLFAVVSAVADSAGVMAMCENVCGIPSLAAGLLEVTGGCVQLAGEQAPPMFLFGFFLGFGGIAVQCQVRAFLHAYPMALRRFFSFRLVHGLLGGIISALLYRIVPLPIQTLAVGEGKLQPFVSTPTVSVVLLMMCMAVMLYTGEKKIAKRR